MRPAAAAPALASAVARACGAVAAGAGRAAAARPSGDRRRARRGPLVGRRAGIRRGGARLLIHGGRQADRPLRAGVVCYRGGPAVRAHRDGLCPVPGRKPAGTDGGAARRRAVTCAVCLRPRAVARSRGALRIRDQRGSALGRARARGNSGRRAGPSGPLPAGPPLAGRPCSRHHDGCRTPRDLSLHARLVPPEPADCTRPGRSRDYVAGPYPATLEGAVRSGMAAAEACMQYRPIPPVDPRPSTMQNRVSPVPGQP